MIIALTMALFAVMLAQVAIVNYTITAYGKTFEGEMFCS